MYSILSLFGQPSIVFDFSSCQQTHVSWRKVYRLLPFISRFWVSFIYFFGWGTAVRTMAVRLFCFLCVILSTFFFFFFFSRPRVLEFIIGLIRDCRRETKLKTAMYGYDSWRYPSFR